MAWGRWIGAVALAGLVLAPAPVRGVAPAGDGIVLAGIVLLDPGGSFAVIEDPGAPRARFYQVGQTIGAGRVTEIREDRVVIVFPDRTLQLRLSTLSGSLRPVAADAGASSDGAPTGAAPTPRRTPPVPPAPVVAQRSAADPKAPPQYGQVASVSPGSAVSAPGEGGAAAGADPAAPGGSSPASTTGSGTPSAQLRISGLLHDASVQTSGAFSADSLRDLAIGVEYANLSGTHSQRVEVYAPDGGLYQRFSGSVGGANETRVPVGGTWITEYAIYGNWAVRVYLDNATTPIASGAFALNR